MPMSYARSEFPADLSAFDLPVERPRPSVERKRSSRGRVLVAFSFGVAATLACQFFYSDTARDMIANSYPQLAWLVTQHTPVRVHIDDVPPGAVLAAGMTATVEMDGRPRPAAKRNLWLNGQTNVNGHLRHHYFSAVLT
jgi:hypothetical protein